ncbi:helix-turn-helix transcriptional regulator [Streptomyces sp. 2RAF24]
MSAALTPSLRDAPEAVGRRFHLDAPAWYQEPETPELLAPVADAVWDDRPVRARYLRGDGEVERELQPYGLVLKAGVWYLCARAGGSFRTYRVDRFTEVVVADGERFERDPGFDLAAFWSERSAEFARSLLRAEVVLRLTPAGARRLPYVTDRAAAEEALAGATQGAADGRVTVTLPVENEEVAFGQLLGLGPEAEVLSPASLRERFAQAAHALAGIYR